MIDLTKYSKEDKLLYYNGRADGIGNRIEQLINIQEYCEENDSKCIYLWQNSSYRNYSPMITFDNIIIKNNLNDVEKNYVLINVQ